MSTVTFRSPMPVTAAEAFAWHRRPGALARLTPPWEEMRVLAATDHFADGTRWTFRSPLVGPIRVNWSVEHCGVIDGRQFGYKMIRGPFRRWEHNFQFIPDGERSFLESHIDYTLPLGLPASLMTKRIERMFAWRHAITAEDLRRHAMFRDRPRMTIAVTGSRGLIGGDLVPFLTSGGHRVVRLISGAFEKPGWDDGTEWRAWSPNEPLPAGSLKGVDAVIHLAGDNIAKGRWTNSKKRRLRDSRVIPTRRLADAIERDGVPVFLSGSAVGYYGNRAAEELSEDASFGAGFLAKLCDEWEGASACSARVVNLRTGIVLSPKGGALMAQLPAFKFGGGAVLGSGEQFVPWIDLQDMVYAIHHLLMSEARGPVNLCSPEPVTNRDFGRTLAKVLRRPFLFTAPPFALRLLFGELADEGLLASQRALPAKLLASGYKFTNNKLDNALRTMLP